MIANVFGTRAPFLVDFAFAASLLAPLLTWISMRLARNRDHDRHRRLQIILLIFCIIAVLALEVEIRLAGGSGALLGLSMVENRTAARVFLGTHISGAVLTYGVWIYLAITSSRRYSQTLPGTYSRKHKKIGKLIFAGLCFTALTAIGMYLLAFVV